MRITYKIIRTLGIGAVSLGAINTSIDWYRRIVDVASTYDPGVMLGNEAIAIIGICAILVSECLKDMSERLDRIQNFRKEPRITP
jgi:hypothetical protein